MTRFSFTISVLSVALTCAAGALAQSASDGPVRTVRDEGEYVAVALNAEPSVDGKTLMVSAYSVILGLFLLYGVSLILRERNVERALSDLKERLGKENRIE